MGVPELRDCLGAANARMDRVLEALRIASPEALDGCARLIELACREVAGGIREAAGTGGEAALGAAEQTGAGVDRAALSAALELRTRIRQARRLLDNVYRFQARWGESLGSRTGGYLPGGQAAPVRSASRVCLRG